MPVPINDTHAQGGSAYLNCNVVAMDTAGPWAKFAGKIADPENKEGKGKYMCFRGWSSGFFLGLLPPLI